MAEFVNVSYFKTPTLRCYILHTSYVGCVQFSECWYQDRAYNPHHVLILEYFHHPPKKPRVRSLSILTNGFPKIKYLCQVSFIPGFRSSIPISRKQLGLKVKDTGSRNSADEQLPDLGEDWLYNLKGCCVIMPIKAPQSKCQLLRSLEPLLYHVSLLYLLLLHHHLTYKTSITTSVHYFLHLLYYHHFHHHSPPWPPPTHLLPSHSFLFHYLLHF